MRDSSSTVSLEHSYTISAGFVRLVLNQRTVLLLASVVTLLFAAYPSWGQDATKDASVRNRCDCDVWLANDSEEPSAVLCQAGNTCRVWFARQYTVYHVNHQNGHFGEQITKAKWNIVLTGKCPNVTATESW